MNNKLVYFQFHHPHLFFSRTDCFGEVRNEHVVWHEAFLEAKVIGGGPCVTRSMKMRGNIHPVEQQGLETSNVDILENPG